MDHLHHSPLGQSSAYASTYDPSLLFPIPRSLGRENLELGNPLPFQGVDLWTAYELSWLTPSGKPVVRVASFSFPCTSLNIVESKSFKLYLNSLNQTIFPDESTLLETLHRDLSAAIQAEVSVKILNLDIFNSQPLVQEAYENLDELEVSTNTYEPCFEFLKHANNTHTTQKLCTHLLKSNCPVTNQPDWATLYIHYTGKTLCKESFLKYIISFREHNEFHEHCVERIYNDLLKKCAPEKLTVYARYSRRGGLDINPFRTNYENNPENLFLSRR